MLKAVFLIALGGGLGSVLRWFFSLSFNQVFPTLPLGTLIANLVAGYLIGVFIIVFINNPSIAPEWRLFIITGCLGGLSTFSTFSAEVATLLQQGRMLWGGIVIATHVIGSISMTLLGMMTVTAIKLLFK